MLIKIISLICFTILSLQSYSQKELNPFDCPCSNQVRACDTINIDRCYLTIEGEKIAIDTNVQEDVEGLFSVVKVSLINTYYHMLYLEKTDTTYLVYDSSIVNNSWDYLVDTSISTKIYNVLVENRNDISNTNLLKEDSIIFLCLRRYYNVVKIPNVKEKDVNDDLATTWSCDQCYTIIMQGKSVEIHDCPFYNNLYRMK